MAEIGIDRKKEFFFLLNLDYVKFQKFTRIVMLASSTAAILIH
jgi:hypothetical protein